MSSKYFFPFFKFYLIFKLYKIVLVLPKIKMNPKYFLNGCFFQKIRWKNFFKLLLKENMVEKKGEKKGIILKFLYV